MCTINNGCPLSLKPSEYPLQSNASDYIRLKKDKAMTAKYIRTGYPSTFPYYGARNEIQWGQRYNSLQPCVRPCPLVFCGKWYACNPKSNAMVI
jgi:hypothetical protein